MIKGGKKFSKKVDKEQRKEYNRDSEVRKGQSGEAQTFVMLFVGSIPIFTTVMALWWNAYTSALEADALY